MRYPEDKIKKAILHPDIEIRNRATSYFAKSCSSDHSLMPLIINAVETYGRQNDAYRLIGLARDLPQTEDTIAWVIDELNDEKTDQYENYAYNLSMVLVRADPALLLPREAEIMESRHFLPSLRGRLTDRLRMLAWDAACCWQMLEEFCEESKDKQYTNEVNLGYANMIVEALARYGPECEPKVREWMAFKLDDYSDHPMKWLEPLVVRLAGQARLESTIPLIVAKLLDDGGDLLNEECSEALSSIGTPAVLEAVTEMYSQAPHHFRLYATAPLEYIHTDLAVEKCLLLLPHEKERALRTNLAHSLLSHFPHEGIEPVRQILVGRDLDFDERHLRNHLVRTCTIMSEQFPEYGEWMAAEKAENEENRRRLKELKGDPYGTLAYAFGKVADTKAVDVSEAKPPVLLTPTIRIPQAMGKVGRNDLCPCGSGKKFKLCCLRK